MKGNAVNHIAMKRRTYLLVYLLGAVIFLALLFTLTACGGTCKGVVNHKQLNNNGTATLQIHKGNGDLCYETATAGKFKGCDAGNNYPGCAG